jgi:hypothetical protein
LDRLARLEARELRLSGLVSAHEGTSGRAGKGHRHNGQSENEGVNRGDGSGGGGGVLHGARNSDEGGDGLLGADDALPALERKLRLVTSVTTTSAYLEVGILRVRSEADLIFLRVKSDR